MDHFYALIMAGGSGTRLWPLSRQARPKQVLPLVEDKSMFQLAVERLAPLLPVIALGAALWALIRMGRRPAVV